MRPQNIGFGGTARGGDGTAAAAEAQSRSVTQAVLEAARSQLSPELWSRLDYHLVFLPLNQEQVMTGIATIQL